MDEDEKDDLAKVGTIYETFDPKFELSIDPTKAVCSS